MTTSPRTVYIVPHTHWDREWYEPFEVFRAQLVQLWDQLLALTESDPDFFFLMDGQSVVIDDYLQVRPQARERLERAVRRGQIQVGPWYTLPDEFLVSGETLVRDLQRGLATADAYGGSMRVGYLPDSFGHAAQMPQLYAQMGFRYAVVWRGVPLSIDRVAFLWEAPDGSRILTAYLGNSYAHGVDLPTEPGALSARLVSAVAAIEPFKPANDVLLMNGNDHVLPQATLSHAVRLASGNGDGTILRLARLDDYLSRLPMSPWPLWHGELRSSARANVLMGTLSVRSPDKRLYAQASRALERLAEPLASLSRVDCTAQLDQAWTLILQNAAHDTACGSGVDAVAEAARTRSAEALTIAQAIVDRCLPAIAGADEVWNPSPFPRQDVVDLDGVPSLTPLIPGCSRASLDSVTPSSPVSVTRRRLENEFLVVDLNPDATVTVLDKQTGVRYFGLNRLVDEADAGDEYNFAPPPEPDEPRLIGGNWEWSVLEPGPVRGRVEVQPNRAIPRGLRPDRRRRIGQAALDVRTTVTLDAHHARLDFDVEVENRSTDHRARAHFPLPFAPRSSAADSAYHVTRRRVIEARHDPGAFELELPSYPMRSFVDVSDGRAGVALITDGLHEYEVLTPPENELALTLLRAVGWLSRGDLSTRTGHAGPEKETPGAQVLGSHRFRYSLHFHEGDWEMGNVWRAAEAALLPLMLGRDSEAVERSKVAPLIELEPDWIQMTACLPMSDGFELRVLNASDQPSAAVVRLEPQPHSAYLLTLGGDLRETLEWRNRLSFRLRPWQIATVRIVR